VQNGVKTKAEANDDRDRACDTADDEKLVSAGNHAKSSLEVKAREQPCDQAS
jgi:hypothetical protein